MSLNYLFGEKVGIVGKSMYLCRRMEYQYHIFSPYRVCPLGAHVDHQHGLVTGFARDKGVDLWFDVREDSSVKLSSKTFEGDV